VNGWGVGDLVEVINQVSDGDVNALIDEYEGLYEFSAVAAINGEKRQNVLDAARIELGLKRFLEAEDCQAFTTNFQTLHGMTQLPGLAVQRLMAQGYGFAGEGDWKTAALLRVFKVLAGDRPGGTSFMEDYTYHFSPGNDLVLGSHMLEVCPSIAKEKKPLIDVQFLGIGNKADPARMIFSAPAGRAVNASVIDLGDRFRLLVNVVDAIDQPQPLPKLPVARALWRAQPSLATASEAWIVGGGAHHTVFSQALDLDDMRLYAEMHNIEIVVIDEHTTMHGFKDTLRWNDLYYRLNK
jgi:L-arabinose isomerase